MTNQQTAVAVFGGGCFWCTEAVFDELRGVKSVVSGYAGGTTKSPTYEQVCSGKTGHAEAIKIEFDPAQISFRDLMTVFFATHAEVEFGSWLQLPGRDNVCLQGRDQQRRRRHRHGQERRYVGHHVGF